MAVRRAHLERRPIALNVPADFMWQDIDYQHFPTGTTPLQTVQPDPNALDKAVGILASVRRPIVLAGWGVNDAARPSLLKLAERIGAPLATTLRGKGLMDGDPYALGIFGTVSTSVATETILAADCVLAFGASLNPWTTAGESLTKNKAIVQTDIDPMSIGAYLPVDSGIVADAGAAADAMIDLLDRAEIPPTSFRTPALAQKLYPRTDDYKDLSTDSTMDIRTALRHFNSTLPMNRSVVVDGGRFTAQAFKSVDVPHPRAFTYAVAFGSIGLGMGTAVGAAVAAPDSPVLMITGDGGFMNGGLTEFNTAVRHKLDLIVVLCNDGAYGAEHIQFRNKDMDPTLSMFDWPDFAPLADALGGRGLTVRTAADLDAATKAIESRDRPILIDLKLDPDRMPDASH
jgi:thiamine pyrophosphate-dependent acetolactate synthase large subunit-like protein